MGRSDDSSTSSRQQGTDDQQTGRSRRRSPGSGGLGRRQVLVLGGLATLGLFAVTQSEFGDGDDEREVRIVLELNAYTLETNDLEGHLDTLHPDAPLYNATESRASETIQNHNVTVELTVESISVDNTTAQAETVRTTRGAADDPAFQDVREQITYDLQRHDGEWLIYNRTVRETEQPPPVDE
jgi:hypothetical protein